MIMFNAVVLLVNILSMVLHVETSIFKMLGWELMKMILAPGFNESNKGSKH